MKKTLIASLFALAASTSMAAELGLTVGRDYATDRNSFGFGLTVPTKINKLSVTGSVERTFAEGSDQDRWSIVGNYDAYTYKGVTVQVKAGGAYLSNHEATNGYAAVAGLGLSMPLSKTVTATVDVMHQHGQDRVTQFDGNRVTAGVKFKF
jgi:hypothetical protein